MYRIKEINGWFYIQVETTEEIKRGHLWWITFEKRIVWKRVTKNGFPYHDRITTNTYLLHKGYRSLKDAEAKIKQFTEEPKYHYLCQK